MKNMYQHQQSTCI